MLIIRPATAADAPRVCDIILTSRAAFLPFAVSPHSTEAMHTWVRERLLPAGDCYVAQQAGELVGILALQRATPHNWIEQLYLCPHYVGQGIGTQLLAYAMQILPLPIRLYTFQENFGARRFYERHGFSAIAWSNGQENEERCADVLYEKAKAAD
jgi:GNAT superfamily N-acetyltransferase